VLLLGIADTRAGEGTQFGLAEIDNKLLRESVTPTSLLGVTAYLKYGTLQVIKDEARA